MEKIIKELLNRGDFVQAVAEEMGKELASQKMKDVWFQDWNNEFYRTLQETVKNAVLEQVNDYMEQYHIKDIVDSEVKRYLAKSIYDILERKL